MGSCYENTSFPARGVFPTRTRSSDFHPSNMATEIRITACKRHDGDQGISDAATEHLCQLEIKDQEEIAKTVGYNDGGVNEKTRKRLVLLIEEKLEETLKGTREEQWEHLEEIRSKIIWSICYTLKSNRKTFY